jgi:hypothetical protein
MGDQFGEHIERNPPERRNPETREQVMTRITREFDVMAGLSLTIPQACRLFGADDRPRCERILREVVERGMLKVNQDGLLVRHDWDAAAPGMRER